MYSCKKKMWLGLASDLCEKKKSQFFKTPFIDPTWLKKRKMDIAVEGSDPMSQVGNDDLNPPESYTEFIASKENIL